MTEKLLFTGKNSRYNTSGRDGGARSSDGHLDIKLKQPHPAAENLFGAAWSACYMGALEAAASQRKIKLPAGTAVDAEIDLNSDAGSYFLRGAPQRQRTGRRPCGCARVARCGTQHLPVLQGDARQYRRCDQSALNGIGWIPYAQVGW